MVIIRIKSKELVRSIYCRAKGWLFRMSRRMKNEIRAQLKVWNETEDEIRLLV